MNTQRVSGFFLPQNTGNLPSGRGHDALGVESWHTGWGFGARRGESAPCQPPKSECNFNFTLVGQALKRGIHVLTSYLKLLSTLCTKHRNLMGDIICSVCYEAGSCRDIGHMQRILKHRDIRSRHPISGRNNGFVQIRYIICLKA